MTNQCGLKDGVTCELNVWFIDGAMAMTMPPMAMTHTQQGTLTHQEHVSHPLRQCINHLGNYQRHNQQEYHLLL